MDVDYWVVDDSVEGFKSGVPLNVWELEDLLYGFIRPWEELGMVFLKFDDSGFGEMSVSRLRCALYETDFRSAVANLCEPHALRRLEQRTAVAAPVTYQEFCDIVSNKRRRSLNAALRSRDEQAAGVDYRAMERGRLADKRSRLAFRLAERFAPSDDLSAHKYYSLQYRCWPPPLFIPAVTVVQIALFVYYSVTSSQVPAVNGPVPVDSAFIYRFDKRHQLWRFATYTLVHAGWWHLIFNLMVQLLIGLPLEMVHGTVRVACIYLAGVLAGSVATSVFDADVYLVGASGGVYSLLAAHVANVLLNFGQVDCALLWIVTSALIGAVDVGVAVWDRYVRVAADDHPVSYAAHVAGAAAGLSLGFALLRCFERDPRHRCFCALSVVLYCSLMIVGVLSTTALPTLSSS